MRRYVTYILFWSILLTFVSFAQTVAAGRQCFCRTALVAATPDATCADVPEADCPTLPEKNKSTYGTYAAPCEWQSDAATCDAKVKSFKGSNDAAAAQAGTSPAVGAVSGQSVLPSLTKCGSQTVVSGECADVSIFVILLIEVANYGFGIIGAIALLFFIYGGFMMIISAGSSERVEQGRNAMVAAVLGLVIAFGGYLLIRFLGEVVGLKNGFRLQ